MEKLIKASSNLGFIFFPSWNSFFILNWYKSIFNPYSSYNKLLSFIESSLSVVGDTFLVSLIIVLSLSLTVISLWTVFVDAAIFFCFLTHLILFVLKYYPRLDLNKDLLSKNFRCLLYTIYSNNTYIVDRGRHQTHKFTSKIDPYCNLNPSTNT